MNQAQFARPLVLALLAAGSSASHAVSYTQNDVTVDINGTINGFYVDREAKVTNTTTGRSFTTNNSELTNGLLPGWINFVVTTRAGDQDVKAHISFAPGINNNSTVIGLPLTQQNTPSGAPNASPNPYSQIDTRNLYFQFGNNSWGTLKFGRDIGLFGQDIILSDMTLLGVGGTSNAGIPYNTTFGMIGHGYMYTGFQPQITYTTPNAGGFQAAVGVFQPSRFAGNETKTPGVQAMAGYAWKGEAPGKVWAGLIHQSTNCTDTLTTTCSSQASTYSADGQEIGVKAGAAGFEGVAYAFAGKGLGLSTTGALFFNGGNNNSTTNGSRVESNGYFLQGTYKFGATKVGLNVGENKDKNGGLVGDIKNRAYTLGVYHGLNKFVTLTAELNQEKITDANALTETKTRSISLGGIMFF